MSINQILDYKLNKLVDPDKRSSVTQADKDFILAQAKTKIQIYCHRQDVPKEAYYIWADMAIEIFKRLEPGYFTAIKEAEMADKVASIKTGDTTVNLSQGSEGGSGGINNGENDEVLDLFSNLLKNFRKLPGGCGHVTHGI